MAVIQAPPMPCVRVLNGAVECYPPAGNTIFAGNILIYVLASS